MRYTQSGRAIAVLILGLLGLPLVSHAAELLRNPNDPAAWKLDVQKGAAATIRQDQGGLRFDITNRGEQNWHVQVYQLGAQVREGATCTLRFTAKASARRPVVITSQTAASPWRTVMTTYPHVELTTEWQPFAVQIAFKQPMTGEPLRLPIFILGDATGTVWIKDVSVTDGSPAQPPSPPAPANPVARPAGSGSNLLANPTDCSSWRFETRDAARATLRSEGGMLRIDVTAAGRERSRVQMYQSPGALVAGRAYLLTISLRATSPRRLTFTAMQGPSGTLVLPATELSITPEWKQYKLRFTLREVAPGQTRLPVLQFGDTAGTTFIRAMSLVEAGDSAAPAQE